MVAEKPDEHEPAERWVRFYRDKWEAAEARVRELEQENAGLLAAAQSLEDTVYALNDERDAKEPR